MLELLFSTTYQNITFFVLGAIISGVTTYISMRFSLRYSKLIYEEKTETVINKDNLMLKNNLEIIYKNVNVDKIVRTLIYFWNSGNNSIRKNDLVSSNKLRITIPEDTRVYSYDILKNTDNANNFQLSEENNRIFLTFNYLEPNNGVKIELLHNNETFITQIEGKVIDLKGEISNYKDRISSKVANVFDLGVISTYLISWSSGAAFLFLCSFIYQQLSEDDGWILFGILGVSVIPAIVSPILLKSNKKKRVHPRKLD